MMRFALYRNTPEHPLRTYEDCVDDFIDQVELRFPLHRRSFQSEWALERIDIALVLLYFAACRAVEPPLGEQLFAGESAGTPHVCAIGFPRGCWDFLGRQGFRIALQRLPELGKPPALRETKQNVVNRFDHAYL